MKKILFFLAAGIFAVTIAATAAHAADNYEIESTETYNIDTVITGVNEIFEFDVLKGRNYIITVNFTAQDEITRKLNIVYDGVTEDQCNPNIYDPADDNDRSFLCKEPLTAGKAESRTFKYATVGDSMTILVSGSVRVDSIVFELVKENAPATKRTAFFIGDSQLKENSPRTGWAQLIGEFFSDDVIIANEAIGGRSTGNYYRQGRLNEVLFKVKPGDYVFVAFGHNDSGSVPDRAVTVTDYKKYLTDNYIAGIKAHGGIPVIVTIANCNTIKKETGVAVPTAPKYVEAAKEVATSENVACIDLNALSIDFLEEFNSTYGYGSVQEYLYTMKDETHSDTTHFSENGAFLIAGIVAGEISRQQLEGLYEYIITPDRKAIYPEPLTNEEVTPTATIIPIAEVITKDVFQDSQTDSGHEENDDNSHAWIGGIIVFMSAICAGVAASRRKRK